MNSTLISEGVVMLFNAFDENLPSRMLIFGAGDRGRRAKSRLIKLGIEVPFFLDNDHTKHGMNIDGAIVIPPGELNKQAPDTPVIICSGYQKTISAQLHNMGIKIVYLDGAKDSIDPEIFRSNFDEINSVFHYLHDDTSQNIFLDVIRMQLHGIPMRYPSNFRRYTHPLVKAAPGDCIIDGGAAQGDTLKKFLKDSHNNASVYLFEPTPETYNSLVRFIDLHKLKKVFTVNKALWSSESILKLKPNILCSDSNYIDESGEYEVFATKLDTYVKNEKLDRVDLIKLDIEGSELEALKGSTETIKNYLPKLQICLYHKAEDLWEIPLFIKSIVPQYKMFIGHHSCCRFDTVLYCCV